MFSLGSWDIHSCSRPQQASVSIGTPPGWFYRIVSSEKPMNSFSQCPGVLVSSKFYQYSYSETSAIHWTLAMPSSALFGPQSSYFIYFWDILISVLRWQPLLVFATCIFFRVVSNSPVPHCFSPLLKLFFMFKWLYGFSFLVDLWLIQLGNCMENQATPRAEQSLRSWDPAV